MKTFTLEERGAQIDRKLAGGVRVPPLELPRNSGERRTESKRRLLDTLERLRRECDAAAAPGNPPGRG